MPSGQSSDVKFEIGHVLFIDIVGYSKGLINEQSESLQKLKEIVRGTEQFGIAEAEGKLLRLPTGDGGALVFRNTPEAPVLCALEISKALKSHPKLRVRMGIHSGPVNEVTDLNDQANIAGAGINMAQRVMDCGDAGHILLSKRVTDDLEHYPQWRSLLHDLGECEVKHGVRVSVVNLYTEELGNPEVPENFQQAKAKEQTTLATAASDAAVRHDEEFWVAVLPFKYSGGNADLTALAEGLTEEIVTGLSRFSYLKVISRSSTSRHANESVDVRSSGKELGARYVMEGSLRHAGAKLRLAVQVVDTISGAHLWAETYERIFSPEALFELQDDLVPRIVSTVADMHGVLPRSMSEVVRLKAADQMSPYEALLRSFGYNERFTPEDLAEVRTCLERAVHQAPGNAECWAMLSLMYTNEYGHWDNAAPDSLDRSLRAARTAVEAAPLHSLPYYALAQALFFKREIPAFRVAAERAVSLNPMDGATAAFMGMLIAYAGDWERGCALSDTGCQLNPNHPGWYRYPAWHDAYRKKDYRKALDVALRLNAPQNYYTHAVLAICYAQLGRMEEARKALRDMLALKPNYAQVARELHGRWIEPDLVEQLMDGLRKAGLEIGGKAGTSATVKASDSGTVRAGEGFWVAVLPFKYSDNNADLTALAEGLTEEIVTGLLRFSYLKVISRSSTLRYAKESRDVRSAGKELGARYVMEGSLRQAGTKLRLAVQLVDAVSGAHLWAENYERIFRPEAVFELQDDLVPRIVSTVADMNGVLPRSMSETVRSRTPEELSPYEAVLRSFGYFERVTAEELAAARSGLDLAVRNAPAYADAWAMLALLCVQEHAQGFNLQADCLTSGVIAARRAIEAAPSNHLAYFGLAQALFFQKEFQSFRNAAERAVVLNPMDGNSIAFLGELLTYAGDWERGMALAARAKQLNPNHPGWYWYADFYNAYRQGDDRAALSFALKINLPGQWFSHAAMAAAYGQLGECDAAGKALRDLLKLRPDVATTVRNDIEKWGVPEYVERMIDGLRKAGLEIVEAEETAARSALRKTPTAPRPNEIKKEADK
jgi:TolB-like protein/Tfp pilus assembly protein PilF/class 3 adenylate cyclase